MEQQFKELNQLYKNNEFEEILSHPLGIYFLKMRTISRAELLRNFASQLNLDIDGIPAVKDQLLQFVFAQDIDRYLLDNFIMGLYEVKRRVRRENEENLYRQLYRLPLFYWGGFYQNNVEQTIVNNYVKKIQNYGALIDKIENDINPRLRGYILCSWYNHWSSILIEDMFKDHEDILPAVGLIKKVDFFWKDFPFDLKVTYFPDGFMKDKRKELGHRPELTELKRISRELSIPIDNTVSDKEIFAELLSRVSEHPSENAQNFISQINQIRNDIINATIQDPTELIKWFYENQGTRRFDAANRFFIVLINQDNLEDSWKLKRNKELLSDNINAFLDENSSIDFNNLKVDFEWEGGEYHTYATCLFILTPPNNR